MLGWRVRQGAQSILSGWAKIIRNALATTSSDGLATVNETAATASATVQISPRNRLSGTGWDADDSVSRTVSFFTEALPVSGNTVTGTWKLGFIAADGTTVTYPLTVTSAGGVATGSRITSGEGVLAASTSFIGVNARMLIDSSADGVHRVTNFAGTNSFTTTLADWGTTLSAKGVSVPVDGTLNLGAAPLGKLTVLVVEDQTIGEYLLRGSANAVTELTDPQPLFTPTKDNAATINIYFDTNAYFIQNKRAGARTLRVVLVGQ